MSHKLPTTIDGVIDEFDKVLDWATKKKTPLGYFPAIYRGVTCTVRDEIAAGNFDDCDRMTEFDICFANRYLDAFYGWKAGRKSVTGSWAASFDAAANNDLTILQHLLLGVNAHMNLDLGCAASTIAPGDSLQSLEPDFVRINTILDGLVDRDRLIVDNLSPTLRELDKIGVLSDHFVDLDIEMRRRRSWEVAQLLAPLEGAAHKKQVVVVDERVVGESHHVINPALLLRIAIREAVKPFEEKDPVVVINALRAEPTIDLRTPTPTADPAHQGR
jgi:hypothetical protein